MRTSIYLLLLLIAGVALPTSLRAQDIQRPLNEEGTLHVIDAELEEKLDLFPEYEDFQEARLFQVSDDSFVLEIYYQPGDHLLRDQRELTAAEVEDLRGRISERLRELRARPALDQGGRTELLVSSTLLSLGFYGYAVPLALDVEGGTEATALYLIISSAGFFGPFFLTRDLSVTDAQAKFFQYGGLRGIAHGALLTALIEGDDFSTQTFMGTALLISLGEGLAGYHLADTYNLHQGAVEAIGVGGDFGLGLGLATAGLIEADDPDIRLFSALGLLGTAAGFYSGYRLIRSGFYTTGDARVLRLAGLLGAYLGLAAVDLIDTDSERIYIGTAMAGTLAGLGAGYRMLSNKNFTGTQGTLITLGTMGGAFIGGGVGYLIGGIDDPTAFLTLSALGAATGFILMYRGYADEAIDAPSSLGWQIHLHPEGLAAYWLQNEIDFRAFPRLITLRGKF